MRMRDEGRPDEKGPQYARDTLGDVSLDVRNYTTPSVRTWVLLALERSQHCSSGVLDLFDET